MDCWISPSWSAAAASLSPLQSVKIDKDEVGDKEEDDKNKEDDEDDKNKEDGEVKEDDDENDEDEKDDEDGKDKEDDKNKEDGEDDEGEFLFSPQLGLPLACTRKILSPSFQNENINLSNQLDT